MYLTNEPAIFLYFRYYKYNLDYSRKKVLIHIILYIIFSNNSNFLIILIMIVIFQKKIKYLKIERNKAIYSK